MKGKFPSTAEVNKETINYLTRKRLTKAQHLIDQAATHLKLADCQEYSKQVTLNLLHHCSEKIDRMLIIGNGTESYREKDND